MSAVNKAIPTVLIAGAGAVGSVLALALARSGIAVTLVDKSVDAAHGNNMGSAPIEARPIALSASSMRILDTLGVWRRIAPHACPIQMVHVGEQNCFGVVRLRASEHRLPALGYVTDAAVIAAALVPAVAQAEPITCLRGTQVLDGVVRENGIRVLFDDQDADIDTGKEAQLLVVADGGQSTLSSNLGIVSDHRDYQQLAVVCTVTPERAHQGTAYERFTLRGPLALLPMSGGDCALVWTLPDGEAQEVAGLGDADFIQALRGAFGRRLGRFTATTARSVYPLIAARARSLHGVRAALIGNAANRLHPVAGQGLNLGLRDAASLADLLAAAARSAQDLGDDALLAAYAQRRRAEHQGVVNFTGALAHGFSAGPAWLGAVRSTAMLALDLLPVGRHLLARHAMGLGRPQARLVRGLNP
jgi:2-octaprenyl-6-methoxyphenol hydroxylase